MPPPDSATSRVWLDEGEVDATWSPPTDPSSGPGVRPGLVYGGIVLALGLVVALVWGLGGFDRRTDVLTDTPVGELISTGPYELRFTEVTAQQRTDYAGVVTWRLTAVGEGRTTGDLSLAPDYLGDDGMFVTKDQASGEVQTATGQNFRGSGFVSGDSFTPGLPLQPFSVEFEYSADYRPGPTLTFVVFDLEFRDNSLLGDQEPQWRNANSGRRLTMPVRELPAQVS